MTAQHILQLGQMLGLSCTELNANGDEQVLPSTILTQALADFGFTDALDVKLEEEIKQFWLRALPPIIIADESAMIQFDLHLPIEFVTEDLIWEIRSNQAVIETGEFTPIEWSLTGIYHLHDMEMQSYQISLEQPLAVGSYQLVILDQGSEEPLGETWLFNPAASLTPVTTHDDSIAVVELPTTDVMLSQLLIQAQRHLPALAKSTLATSTATTLPATKKQTAASIAEQLAQLQAYFNTEKSNSAKDNSEFAQQLKNSLAAAELYQLNLARYLTAYAATDTIVTFTETQAVEWQDNHSGSIEFYLWLLTIAKVEQVSWLREINFACFTLNANSFTGWLLADYQLANCQLENMLVTGEAEPVVAWGVNSYQLRQDSYAAFRSLIDFTASQSAALILNQPLSIMQQWLTIGDTGIWQNHEFNELLSIILLSCERHSCDCYYQVDEELPTELTDYLQARGIKPLSVKL